MPGAGVNVILCADLLPGMDAIPPGTFGPTSTPQPVVVGMIGTAGMDERPAKMMSFTDAFRTCMVTKYFVFQGRASRSEFWWFQLGLLGISILAGFLSGTGIDLFESAVLAGGGVISNVVMLVTIIPTLAATSRRLHDSGRSGYRILYVLIPLIGAILLLVWLISPGGAMHNEYGDVPTNLA